MSRMKSFLYIYDINNLSKLKQRLSEYKFVSVAYFLNLVDTVEEINAVDSEDINALVIDITNMIKDGNYYRIFTERYLWALSENIDNIHFCLQSDYLDSFIHSFPYLFEEENINVDFHEGIDDTIGNEIKICAPLDLCIYKSSIVIKRLLQNNSLISLSNLVDECEGIAFNYNINRISATLSKMKIEYVDISSVIKTLKLRKDLVFLFEILIHQISKIKDLKFSLESSLLSDTLELFPLIFAEAIELVDYNAQNEVDDDDSQNINLELVNLQLDKINEALKGHTAFKSDFKHNLLKFYFLNKLGERKILSIYLCGDSGIGKTEFAKIVSRTLFPEESLIKINFGNYSTEGVLNSLIGSPLGYVGSEEGGELINKISMSKSKVILIDEFERATPSVYNFFYELLEDGIFTDRHGVAHNLNGYTIVFTSNMTQVQYQKHIPNSLKSRFDMVYYFIDIPIEEKAMYINTTTNKLIDKLYNEFGVEIATANIEARLNELVNYTNLRDIKRRIEDIVFMEFFKNYSRE